MIKKRIEFFRHNLSVQDIGECVKVLHSIFLTTGDVVKQFEKKFARYLGLPYVVGVTSCTDALFLALKYYNIGPGDEVITTPMSFVATANAIEYCGAKPIFVDVEKETGNIDANLIESAITKNTKAILVVHLYGQMCDMKRIRNIANTHKLKIIEDAAHCIEGKRDDVRVGELGDITCFSFYTTKTMTCGEGGAIACHTKRVYEWLLRARSHGISKNAAERYTKKYQHYDMEFLGYKMNMTNIQAALLIHQMDKLELHWEKRERISALYTKHFSKNGYIHLFSHLPRIKHALYIFPILVQPQKRDRVMHALQENGIGVAVNFRPIHLMSYYRKKYGFQRKNFPQAEYIGDSVITIPLYPKLTRKEIFTIIRTVNEVISSLVFSKRKSASQIIFH